MTISAWVMLFKIESRFSDVRNVELVLSDTVRVLRLAGLDWVIERHGIGGNLSHYAVVQKIGYPRKSQVSTRHILTHVPY